MKDSEILQWLHNRLVNVHGENRNYDYMHKMREIITQVDLQEQMNEAMVLEPSEGCKELLNSWKQFREENK